MFRYYPVRGCCHSVLRTNLGGSVTDVELQNRLTGFIWFRHFSLPVRVQTAWGRGETGGQVSQPTCWFTADGVDKHGALLRIIRTNATTWQVSLRFDSFLVLNATERNLSLEKWHKKKGFIWNRRQNNQHWDPVLEQDEQNHSHKAGMGRRGSHGKIKNQGFTLLTLRF